MKNIIDMALSRLKEKSTWAGIATLAALVGMKVSPELLTQVSTTVIGAISLYEVIRKEAK
jgi:hypothetical protein